MLYDFLIKPYFLAEFVVSDVVKTSLFYTGNLAAYLTNYISLANITPS